jgi:hypothetical protein
MVAAKEIFTEAMNRDSYSFSVNEPASDIWTGNCE